VEVVASLSQGRTAAGQCGLFTYKSVPVIFEPPCSWHHFTHKEFFALQPKDTEITQQYGMMLPITIR